MIDYNKTIHIVLPYLSDAANLILKNKNYNPFLSFSIKQAYSKD